MTGVDAEDRPPAQAPVDGSSRGRSRIDSRSTPRSTADRPLLTTGPRCTPCCDTRLTFGICCADGGRGAVGTRAGHQAVDPGATQSTAARARALNGRPGAESGRPGRPAVDQRPTRSRSRVDAADRRSAWDWHGVDLADQRSIQGRSRLAGGRSSIHPGPIRSTSGRHGADWFDLWSSASRPDRSQVDHRSARPTRGRLGIHTWSVPG